MGCPECEYCCAIGLCCSADAQLATLTKMFVGAGATEADAARYAQVIVDARAKAQKHHERRL